MIITKQKISNIFAVLILFIPFAIRAEGFVAFADLLAWQASQQTSSTWATFVKESSANTLDLDATNVSFDWNLGFRGGAVFESQSDKWDTALYWTYFPSKANSYFRLGRQIVIPEFFSGFLSKNFFFGANLDWRITMNIVDIEFGHKFKPAKNFMFRPAIGIKGGTIYQAVNCSWYADIYTASEVLNNNFSGIGPSLYLDSKWLVYENFSVFGDFSTAFMWGNWQVKDTYSRPAAGLVTATTITTSMNDSKLGTMMFAYVLGLEWSYKGRSNITVQLGYEMQFWANQLRLVTFQQLPVHGDLTLQGGTCRIRIDL